MPGCRGAARLEPVARDDKVDDGGHGPLVPVGAHERQVVRRGLGAELAHVVRRRLPRAVQRLLPLHRLLRGPAALGARGARLACMQPLHYPLREFVPPSVSMPGPCSCP